MIMPVMPELSHSVNAWPVAAAARAGRAPAGRRRGPGTGMVVRRALLGPNLKNCQGSDDHDSHASVSRRGAPRPGSLTMPVMTELR